MSALIWAERYGQPSICLADGTTERACYLALITAERDGYYF